ncbi:hypothetical protein GCM10011519_10000 [Marmoricola endophyticus]|uniref:Uncharacterized protein n=1 Tax=Marmoricola endophyticus TaxID=2040280 RepID=A0A917F333_9ACTN|nr:hypothetical protein [Marmoricola endophyticus]GGF38399.1 hypothetical protein GCM10011519_10000 [Marmoricola endophyticus]
MNPFRSRRGWLPAVLAAVLLVGGTFALQELSDRVYDGRARPQGDAASLWDWLGQTYLGLFGPYSRSADTFGDKTALVAYGVVAFIVAVVVSWRALRALAPGSGSFPAWLSMWTAMVLATVFGNLAYWVVGDYDTVTGGAAAAPLLATLSEGCAFGVKWGWVPALVATLFWVAVRPKPDRGDIDNDIVFDPDGTGYRDPDGSDERTRAIPQVRRPEEPHPDAPYR